jgi:MarR-like DNA-binding transcriptional regulator SgrR of sgrS sRNA
VSATSHRVLTLLLALALPVVAKAALGPRYGGDLTVGVPDLPANVDVAVPYGSGPGLCQALVHETLVDLDAEGLPVPALAASWSATRDGTAWTMNVRGGAVFHDGTPITAADAVRSLRRFLRAPSAAAEALAGDVSGGAAFRAGRTEDLPGLQAADGRRVVLRFERAPARPLTLLSSPAAAITSSGGAAAGPFVPTLAAAGRLTLTAFGGHVRGRPFLDSVALVEGVTMASVDAELRARRLDLAPVTADGSRAAATLLLVLDARKPPFDRPEARAAMAGTLPAGPLMGRFLPGSDATPRLLVPPLLPVTQATSLPAATVPLPSSLTLAVDREVPPLLSQRVVAFLANAGTRVSVQAVSAAEARAPAALAPARLLLFRPEVAEASLALRELMALGGADPRTLAEVEAAAREGDPARRQAQLARVETALRARHVLLPLASLPLSFRARPGIHDVRLDSSGRLTLEDAWSEP